MPDRDPEQRRECKRLYMAEWYAERSTRGLCVRCGTAAVPGKKMCVYCLVRDIGYTRMRRKRLIVRGLCIHCAVKPHRTGKQACLDCAVRMREIRDAARQKKESDE